MLLQELISYSAGLAHTAIGHDTAAACYAHEQAFSRTFMSGGDINVFIYHADMQLSTALEYCDVVVDPRSWDYEKLLHSCLFCIFKWHPTATVYFVTSSHNRIQVSSAFPRVRVLPFAMLPNQPMYERVRSMYAYVCSSAFNNNTIFLDTDAFLNASLNQYLNLTFDIGITVRDSPGLMPVNEGVILVRRENVNAIRSFFKCYVATYERLASDQQVLAHYGDIKQWRGGQLTLNAITHHARHGYGSLQVDGECVRIKSFDCNGLNFSADGEISADEITKKVIVHLKGNRKALLDRVFSILNGTD